MSTIGAGPKLKNPDNFAIMKNAAPNFLYVGLLMLSYLKSGPKVRGRWGTECWGETNYRKKLHQKFLQNPLLGCQWNL